MTKNQIKKALEDVLFKEGKMEIGLYEYELEELQQDLIASLKEDGDDYIFTLSVHTNDMTLQQDVAILLIEESGDTYINEAARDKLKELWEDAYVVNMRNLMPDFILQLYNSELPIHGGKIVI